jgi:hypothetical protein
MNKQRVFLSGLIIILLVFTGPKIIRYFRYNKAEGTVIRINTGVFNGLARLHNNLGDSTNRVAFNYPTIAYRNDKSEEVFYNKNNEVLYNVFKVGDKVTVIYNPDNPQEAWLNEFGSFWFALPDLMIVGIFIIAWFGIVNIIFVKPRKKKTAPQKTNP